MSSLESVSQGIEEALAFANGDKTHAKVHQVLDGEINASLGAKPLVELDDTWNGYPKDMRAEDIDFFDLDS